MSGAWGGLAGWRLKGGASCCVGPLFVGYAAAAAAAACVLHLTPSTTHYPFAPQTAETRTAFSRGQGVVAQPAAGATMARSDSVIKHQQPDLQTAKRCFQHRTVRKKFGSHGYFEGALACD